MADKFLAKPSRSLLQLAILGVYMRTITYASVNSSCPRPVCPPPRGIWQLKRPHRREFAIQGKKMLIPEGQPRGGGSWVQLELTEVLRFSNSKHFRFYWTKKNHEIGSLVVRKVKTSWDSRQNREHGPASLGSRRTIVLIFSSCLSPGRFKKLQKFITSVSKLPIVLIWNIQSPLEDNRPATPVKCTKSAHGDRGTGTIYDSCRFDIGRFRVEPTDLRKVSTFEWQICIS